MKILLDENLPYELRPLLMPEHEVYTVGYLRWKGTRNGALLARAAAEGFEVLITVDKSMEHEQNPATLPCAVIVLHVKQNDIVEIKPMLPALIQALGRVQPRTVLHVP